MGGAVPFGYRVENRALHVVEEHAEFVRDLFSRYLELGSVVRLKAALDAENVRLPVRIVGTGRDDRRRPDLSRPPLLDPLEPDLCRTAAPQGADPRRLASARSSTLRPGIASNVGLRSKRKRGRIPIAMTNSFLAGKLYDDRGNRMGPSHAAKGGRRWRYYISRAILKGRNSDAGSITRVPAAQIEKQVFDAIQRVIASKRSNEGFGALSLLGLSGRTISSTGKPCQALSSYGTCSTRSSGHDWRDADRDPAERVRCRRWPGRILTIP